MSQLDQIIPPEVKGDEFYLTLNQLASNPTIRNILEIGSSSGEGSTQALVDGIISRKKFDDVSLFCMELSRPRFFKLTETYANNFFVKTYNLSSVAICDFPSRNEVEFFYKTTKTNLNNFSLETVYDWIEQDIKYIKDNSLDFEGISFIKAANKMDLFDFVLIDGSEFTGERELAKILGAKIIALDDVNTFKCFSSYNILSSHFGYKLIAQNLQLRNGYAVFERKY